VAAIALVGSVIGVAGVNGASAESTLRVLPAPTSGGIEEMSDDGSVVVGPNYLLTAEGVQSLDPIRADDGFSPFEVVTGVSGDGSTVMTRDLNPVYFTRLRDTTTLSFVATLSDEGPFFVSYDGRSAVHGEYTSGPVVAVRRDLDASLSEWIPRPSSLPAWDIYPWHPGVLVGDVSGDSNTILASVAVSGFDDSELMLWTPTSGSQVIQPLVGVDVREKTLSSNGRHVAFTTRAQGAPPTDNELYLMTDIGTPTLLDTSATMLLTVSEVSDDGSRILGTREGLHGVWDDGAFEDLATLLAAAGLDLGAFTQDLQALDMSPDGQRILGSSSDGANTQYWIADFGAVPEPGTGLLMGAGLAWLGRRRQRASAGDGRQRPTSRRGAAHHGES
jgi:hypothetical protein